MDAATFVWWWILPFAFFANFFLTLPLLESNAGPWLHVAFGIAGAYLVDAQDRFLDASTNARRSQIKLINEMYTEADEVKNRTHIHPKSSQNIISGVFPFDVLYQIFSATPPRPIQVAVIFPAGLLFRICDVRVE
eukprot:TRINITY_DN1343_c0_g1_i1.p1 TRINITY_DN1343_c0_g1~~TRINITY_DN1343_c0_g1_i1.p1  ORF type:complete len:135 (+),score=19.44 TRINITY_DN1343_c0_g1_i1:174-578(+)